MNNKEVEKSRVKEIYKHPNFELCGIKISSMTYNEENGLFFLESGICRVTSTHLLSAIRSSNYRRYLEKEIDMRKGVN